MKHRTEPFFQIWFQLRIT